MLLLAIDTATPAVAVALRDEEGTRGESSQLTKGGRHGELLAPAIARLLDDAGAAPADLTAVAVGVGPGPFTGLRVGLVTAVAFGDTLGIPVHGACSLDVLAWQSGRKEPFLVATDARRKEVYWARYADARTPLTEPAVGRPDELATAEPVLGQAPALYPQHFPGGVAPEHPAASALAELVADQLARGEAPLPPAPLYLRRPDDRMPGPRKQVLPADHPAPA